MIIQFLFESVEALKVTLRFNHLRLIKQFSIVLFLYLHVHAFKKKFLSQRKCVITET